MGPQHLCATKLVLEAVLSELRRLLQRYGWQVAEIKDCRRNPLAEWERHVSWEVWMLEPVGPPFSARVQLHFLAPSDSYSRKEQDRNTIHAMAFHAEQEVRTMECMIWRSQNGLKGLVDTNPFYSPLPLEAFVDTFSKAARLELPEAFLRL
jgi:hypothetical protein